MYVYLIYSSYCDAIVTLPFQPAPKKKSPSFFPPLRGNQRRRRSGRLWSSVLQMGEINFQTSGWLLEWGHLIFSKNDGECCWLLIMEGKCIVTNLQFHELSGTFGGDGFLYQTMILFLGGLTSSVFAMSAIVAGGWIFLGISIGRLNHLLLLRSVYPLQRWNAALFTWAKVARNEGRMPQLKRVVDHNGQQWHLLGFGDQPPKPDLQKGHTERSVETCRNWICLFCLNQKGWHFWELEGHLLKLVFFLNSLHLQALQLVERFLSSKRIHIPHLPRKGKSEIHL